MTLRTRLGILITFCLIFLVTAPLVILYTAGYRWNNKKQRIEKVGLLFLRSKPADAAIFLNAKLRRERTPTRIRNLIPGNYEVRMEKNGHLPWSKQLPVESELTTFAEGVFLFPETQPAPLTLKANLIVDGPGDRTVLIRSSGGISEVALFDMDTGNETAVYRSKSALELTASFSADGNRLLIITSRGTLQVSALEFRTDNPTTPTQLLTVEPEDWPVSAISSPSNDRRAITDGFEIALIDREGNREVITRLGEEIVSIVAHPSAPYVFYQTKTAIHAIEFDGRDRRNDVLIATGQAMGGMSVDARSSHLYFAAEKDGVATVFKYPLQLP